MIHNALAHITRQSLVMWLCDCHQFHHIILPVFHSTIRLHATLLTDSVQLKQYGCCSLFFLNQLTKRVLYGSLNFRHTRNSVLLCCKLSIYVTKQCYMRLYCQMFCVVSIAMATYILYVQKRAEKHSIIQCGRAQKMVHCAMFWYSLLFCRLIDIRRVGSRRKIRIHFNDKIVGNRMNAMKELLLRCRPPLSRLGQHQKCNLKSFH